MSDVRITRGRGFLDDFEATTNWTVTNPPSGTLTHTNDGDISTLTAAFGAGTVSGDSCYIARTGLSIDILTYISSIFRFRINTLTGVDSNNTSVLYRAGGANQTNHSISAVIVLGEVLAAAKWLTSWTLVSGTSPIDELRVRIQTNTAGAKTIILKMDHILDTKEFLHLPSVDKPIPLAGRRRQVVLPILDREGGIIQDLGSDNLEVVLNGSLLTTSQTTGKGTYTAGEWWDVLQGIWLEAQGETWQWLESDRVKGKYLISEFFPTHIPGRVAFHDFQMRLRKVEILSATADSLGTIS